MSVIGWDETTPADTESAGLGDDRIRSLKTSLRQGLDTEHVWPSTGGDSGVHRLGSARVYYGPESNVSSSGTDGRLMVASDTSRLFHVGSGGTMLLGDARLLSVGSTSASQTAYWAVEFGQAITNSSGTTAVSYTASFNGIPFTYLTPVVPNQSGAVVVPFVWGVGQSVFGIGAATAVGGFWSNMTINWVSIGTRTL